MKTILFALLLTQGFYCVAQSQLDERICKLVDSLNLSEKKLAKLEQIRIEEGVNSENWARAYAKWDKSNAFYWFSMREEILSFSQEMHFVSTQYSSGKGLGTEYMISLLDQLLEKKAIHNLSYTFCINVLYHQGDNSNREIEYDVGGIEMHLRNDQLVGGPGMDDYRKMNAFLEIYIPDWVGLDLKAIYDSIGSMSEIQLGLLTRFCGLEELSTAQFNVMNNRFINCRTETGMEFYEILRATYGLGTSNIGVSEKWIEPMNTDYLKWRPFFSNPTIREIVVGNMLYTQLVHHDLTALDLSSFGQSSLAATGMNASYWYSFLEDQLLGIFRIMSPHDNTGEMEMHRFISAMQNGMYFQLIPSLDSNYEQLDKLRIEDLNLTEEQRIVINDFIQNGSVMQSNQHLVWRDLINRNWQQNIHFRMALYLANLKCAQTTTSDWYGNQVKENPFDGTAVMARNKSDQYRLDRMKKTFYSHMRESKATPKRYIITTKGDHIMGCYPPLGESELSEVWLAFYEMYHGGGEDYYRFVLDMNQLREADSITEPLVLELYTPIDYQYKDVAPPPPPVMIDPMRNTEIYVEIVDFPDVEASFPGGPYAMKDWLAANMFYPEIAMELGDQGRVYVNFVVEADGSISGIEVPRSLTKELDREAKRLVREMPNWTPGLVKGEKVRSRCRIPITFTLE